MPQRIVQYARYIAWAGAAAIAVALGAWLVLGQIKLWIEIVGAVGIVLVAVPVLLNPREARAALTGRQARYGGNAVLMSVAFVTILGLVNYLGARHHARWDVTADKQFSLSEQSIQVLGSLKEPVRVKLFFTPGAYGRQEAEDLIKEYAVRSSNLTYEFIDPDLQRREAMAYQVARDGTIIFERGERREVTFGTQEQDMTGALVKVLSDQAKGVYFLTGHQERDPESSEATGYSGIKGALEGENYTVGAFNYAVTSTAPMDMDVLVIAAPQKPLSADEVGRVKEFVGQGGSVLVLAEPGAADPFGGLLAEYGVTITDDLIVDPAKSFFGDIAAPLVDRYGFHQITKDLGGLSSFFPTARSLTISETPPEDWTAQYLAQTSENAWGETGYREQQVKPDEAEPKGPLGLAVVVEPVAEGSGRGRLVVIGDADFVSNGLLQSVQGNLGNVDLFMNSVGWLAEEESLISIRPKQPEQRQVTLTPPQARMIIYSSILFVPLIVLGLGVMVWWRRR